MLTVDFDRLGIREGERVLDIGCGFGRHAYEAARLGANVAACDMSLSELKEVRSTAFAISKNSPQPSRDNKKEGSIFCTAGDITSLPFSDGAFDRIIASEVLEHITDDVQAMRELYRVLDSDGTLAVTVPAYFSEKICWQLSGEYHAPKAAGGHVRVYTRNEIKNKLAGTGFLPRRRHHKAHALHSPFWWLRCLAGPNRETTDNRLVDAYHRFLCWQLMQNGRKQRRLSGQAVRLVEGALNPVLGKSLVVYAEKRDKEKNAAD